MDGSRQQALVRKARAFGRRLRGADGYPPNSRIARRGLPAGTPAPAFRLPDLDGRTRSSDEFRGRATLLVFSDPDCRPCDEIAPELEALHGAHARGVNVVMIARGDVAANRAKAEEHGLTFPVLLQKGWSVSKRYAMFAAPIAYHVDAGGATSGEVAVGPEPIRRLIAGFSGEEGLAEEGAARRLSP